VRNAIFGKWIVRASQEVTFDQNFNRTEKNEPCKSLGKSFRQKESEDKRLGVRENLRRVGGTAGVAGALEWGEMGGRGGQTLHRLVSIISVLKWILKSVGSH
jgi:hypothetical protein